MPRRHYGVLKDIDGLQSFDEQRGQQLETEQSPEGEACRLVNQSPGRYYPNANEQQILGAMELGDHRMNFYTRLLSKQSNIQGGLFCNEQLRNTNNQRYGRYSTSTRA